MHPDQTSTSVSPLIRAIRARAHRYNQNPLILPMNRHLSEVRSDYKWVVFKTLADAIQYHQQRDHTKLFACETKSQYSNGKRIYIAADYELFYHYYRQFPPSKRHYYEVILEGDPCKLYFDLEFDIEINEGLNGQELSNTFMEFVCLLLKLIIDVTATLSNIMVLNSINSKKFSQHLIFSLPNVAFKNNIVVGMFVSILGNFLHKICFDDETKPNSVESDIRSKFSVAELRRLRVKRKGDDEIATTWIFDQSVYNRNRNFRLYRSSKLGRTDELEINELHAYYTSSFKQIFMDSLVCNVDLNSNCRIITEEEFKDLPYAVTKLNSRFAENKKIELCGVQNSPFVEIDNFINSLITRDGHTGRIRKWTFFTETQRILYEIVGYRFCERLQRHHKSNNIMFIVDVKNKIFYQRCFDHDCKHFEPARHPLPDYTLPWLDLSDNFD
ncbi:hypothetical protein GJ496_006231 [Pomphorhynchus laevis]|nr:hypothetical protein GJ496_006231 [Pomphorhynchus laevis]